MQWLVWELLNGQTREVQFLSVRTRKEVSVDMAGLNETLVALRGELSEGKPNYSRAQGAANFIKKAGGNMHSDLKELAKASEADAFEWEKDIRMAISEVLDSLVVIAKAAGDDRAAKLKKMADE